jgi:hypothetical protein
VELGRVYPGTVRGTVRAISSDKGYWITDCGITVGTQVYYFFGSVWDMFGTLRDMQLNLKLFL